MPTSATARTAYVTVALAGSSGVVNGLAGASTIEAVAGSKVDPSEAAIWYPVAPETADQVTVAVGGTTAEVVTDADVGAPIPVTTEAVPDQADKPAGLEAATR